MLHSYYSLITHCHHQQDYYHQQTDEENALFPREGKKEEIFREASHQSQSLDVKTEKEEPNINHSS